MDLLKQMRELVAGVDLSDEEREAFDALFTDLEAQDETQRSQITVFEAAQAEADADEDTEESRKAAAPEVVLDLGPVADKLGEFAEPIAKALRTLNQKMDAIVAVATEDVDEGADEGSAEADTEERSADADDAVDNGDERLGRIERSIQQLTDALPVRRGVVGDSEDDGSDEDNTQSELERELEGVTDPKVRLRATLGAHLGEE